MYGVYVQDDWRVTDRLTLNLGVRWDYVDGMPIDQSSNPNFQAMQAAGRAGRFAGTLLDDFGRSRAVTRTTSSRALGVAYDLRGDGRDVVRGGWGIYTDFGYINSNVLTAAFDAAGGSGHRLPAPATQPGCGRPDGSLVHASPIRSRRSQSLNLVNPDLPLLAGEVVSPRLEQPYTIQTNSAGRTSSAPRRR